MDSPLRIAVTAISFVALCALGGCGGADGSDGRDTEATGPQPSVSETVTAPVPQQLAPIGASASATAPSSTDEAGNAVTYKVENVLDGDPTTAWRVSGDGAGIQIVFDFGGAVHLTELGLIPGYAKVDPSGTDRFVQNRRLVTVQWDFADGTVLNQTFLDEPTMQTLPADITTTWARLTVISTTEDGGRDFTPISDVWFEGTVG